MEIKSVDARVILSPVSRRAIRSLALDLKPVYAVKR